MSFDNNSADFIAGVYVNYLFQKYPHNRHVRRVASWVGFVVMAVKRTKGITHLDKARSRQLAFEYENRKFKVKYGHDVGERGGIEVVEILPQQGSPKGKQVMKIEDLKGAERAYLTLGKELNKFVAKNP